MAGLSVAVSADDRHHGRRLSLSRISARLGKGAFSDSSRISIFCSGSSEWQ